ncbi:MAG: kaiC [Labilithrix sp.]|nr:kaiC [Labilithrix sp.]
MHDDHAEDEGVPMSPPRASSGVVGLDDILDGGFTRGDTHVLDGAGGTGKTTFALRFLLAGRDAGERCLFITMSQTEQSLRRIARSHGWPLTDIGVRELLPGIVSDEVAVDQTVLHSADLELGELTSELRALITETKPERVVIDSLGVLGLLANDATRYHRELVALRQFLVARGCTTLFVSEGTGDAATARRSEEFYGTSSSVIHLEQEPSPYGEVRRRLRVLKMRAVAFATGFHNFAIRRGRLDVFARLHASEACYSDFETLPSGNAQLDGLLGGGLEKGTACLFVGPPGAGKSTISTLFVAAAAARGEQARVFLFDERPETYAGRAKAVGMDLDEHLASGRVQLDKLDGSRITAGEFSHHVQEAIESGARTIVIDSLTGYFHAMANASMLALQMHELLDYASRRGVLTMLLIAQPGMMSVGSAPEVDVSYLSDTIVVFRSFEAIGEIRRCLAAVKKRQSGHDTSIRELLIGDGKVAISTEPMRELHGMFGGATSRTGPS